MTVVRRHQPTRWRATASGWCPDVADPKCVALAGDGLDPVGPMSFAANLPPGFVHPMADSEALGAPGCDRINPGTAMPRPALEASVADATAGTGQQITSGRVRFHVTPG